MPKYLAKRAIWILILLLVGFIAWHAISEAAYLEVYFQQGADPGSALNIVPNVPLDIHVGMKWLGDDADTGRPMDDFTRIQIQSAYLRAWLQWNLSLVKNTPYGLKTYFVGPALADLDNTITATAHKGWQIDQADTNHLLQLHVFAADGSIVSFSDLNSNTVQIIHDKKGSIIYVGENTSTYDVVMMLSDGNWRVRHMVRTGDITQESLQHLDLQTPYGFVGRRGNQLVLDNQIYHMAGINYYPQATPWDKFWLNYNPEIIENDFSLIHSLGLNTIRIFIPFDQFGGANINNPGAGPTKTKKSPAIVVNPLDKLSDLLLRAGEHQLHVLVTLFDFHSDYSLLHWSDADRQLEALLTTFRESPEILAWDLKNEPDQDWKSAGVLLVNAWLAHVARMARSYDNQHLLTVGWSSPQAAETHIPNLDLVSFHYYDLAQKLQGSYKAIQHTNPGLPIAITEFGLPTWNSPFFPNGHTQAEQAEYYADILSALRKTDSAGYAAWTLYDFTYAPSTVAGGLPWQSAPQKQLGIIQANGILKPAAHLLVANANLQIARLPWWAHIMKPFWLTATSGLITLIALIFINIRHHKKHPKPQKKDN